MGEPTRTVNARCLCGSAKHEVTLPTSAFPLKAEFCHCNSCRHMTGTLCLTVLFAPPEYQPAKELIDKLQPYQFSQRLTQYFCPKCGSHMLARVQDREDPYTIRWDLATGTLEEADGVFEVQDHELIEDTVDGGFSDFLAVIDEKHVHRWSGHRGKGEELPLYWQSPDRPSVKPSPTDRLHAHCKCGGVEFWIARPSERSSLGRAPWPDVIIPFTYKGAMPPADEAWWLPAGGTKFLAGLCACDSCRLACGMEWVEWAFVPTVDISPDAEGKTAFPPDRAFGTMKQYQSSKGTRRHFCGSCGASVFWDGDERPTVIDVAVGLLEAPEGARAESWLQWRTPRLSYREDAMPRAGALTLSVEAGMRAFGVRYQGEPVDANSGPVDAREQ